MKRSCFSEEQIIGILKEHQAGLGAKELCRKHGVSDATFYKWRSKYGGMEVSDAKKMKALDAGDAKLKKLLAEQLMYRRSRKCWEKTFEARFEEECCELGHEELPLERHWSERQWRRVTISAVPVRWPGSIRVCIDERRSALPIRSCGQG